jgi:hypothetical protein
LPILSGREGKTIGEHFRMQPTLKHTSSLSPNRRPDSCTRHVGGIALARKGRGYHTVMRSCSKRERLFLHIPSDFYRLYSPGSVRTTIDIFSQIIFDIRIYLMLRLLQLCKSSIVQTFTVFNAEHSLVQTRTPRPVYGLSTN